jgi:TolA-binding protein
VVASQSNEQGAAEDDRMMANMIVAKNFQSDSALTNAANAYQQVIKLGKSEYSAEAQYCIAQILYLQNQLPAAEKAAIEVIKKYGSNEYWVTDSYLLLGDIYFKENDLFNAEATYKSVAENATIEALKKEAADNLAMVQAAKNKQPKTN